MMVGIDGDATCAKCGEGKRAFGRRGVLPLGWKVAGSRAHWLGSQADREVSWEGDRDRVPALQAERDAEWGRIASADFLTADEKRRMLGLAPVGPE